MCLMIALFLLNYKYAEPCLFVTFINQTKLENMVFLTAERPSTLCEKSLLQSNWIQMIRLTKTTEQYRICISSCSSVFHKQLRRHSLQKRLYYFSPVFIEAYTERKLIDQANNTPKFSNKGQQKNMCGQCTKNSEQCTYIKNAN